jgi:Glutamine amidotransferases class-II
MCLIIHKPAGRHICSEFLAHAWEHNAHGWGCFFAGQEGVRSFRGMRFEDLAEINRTLPRDAEVYLHVRKATYGEIHQDMAHPYEVRPGLMLMHNGTIHHMAPKDPRISDSCELARTLRNMLEGLSDGQAATLLRSAGFRRLTAPLIEGSVVVLQDAWGAVRLGRDWHTVRSEDWHPEMAGIEVSNTHAWRPGSRMAVAA